MADITFTQLAAKAAPTTSDEIPIWDVAASQAKKATIQNIINSRLTGGGVVATGGFTLTVPATGTAALLSVANTFTIAQTIAPSSTGGNGAVINMPAGSSAVAALFQVNGVNAARVITRDDVTQFVLDARNLGNNVGGPLLSINRNTNAGAEGPAPGTIFLVRANGNPSVLWVDNAADLRIHNAIPTGSTGSPTVNITAGVVVGTQTSMAKAKYIADDLSSLEEVAERIQAGAEAVRRFIYRSGKFNGEQFEGVITDLAPHYGMDRDKYHPQGKSLNEIQILGDLLRMVAHLLEGRSLSEVEGR